MIAIVLALALVSPAPRLLDCTAGCFDFGDHYQCLTVPRQACLKREQVCVESAKVDCVPLVVNLGAWDPVPTDRPAAAYTPEHWPDLGGPYNVTPPASPYPLP